MDGEESRTQQGFRSDIHYGYPDRAFYESGACCTLEPKAGCLRCGRDTVSVMQGGGLRPHKDPRGSRRCVGSGVRVLTRPCAPGDETWRLGRVACQNCLWLAVPGAGGHEQFTAHLLTPRRAINTTQDQP